MKLNLHQSILVTLLAALVVAPLWAADADESQKKENSTVPAPLNFTMKNIDGEDVKLSKYQGEVILMVNVASKCGATPQYAGLQKLHEKYHDKGLAVLGFPSNDFGGQEPGSEADIEAFCQKNYGVTFDMFSKVTVKGDSKCDLYKLLTTTDAPPAVAPGEVGWNFEKFLISRDGKVVGRFKTGVTPDAEPLVKAIEAELAKK